MASLTSCIPMASNRCDYFTLNDCFLPDLEKGEAGKLINRKCALCDDNMSLDAKTIYDLYHQPSLEARIAGLAALKLRVLYECGHLAHAHDNLNGQPPSCMPCTRKLAQAMLTDRQNTIDRNSQDRRPDDCRTSCCKILTVSLLFSMIIYPFVV